AIILRPLADHLASLDTSSLPLPARCGLVQSCPRPQARLSAGHESNRRPIQHRQDRARLREWRRGTLIVPDEWRCAVNVIVKRFDNADEVRRFTKGRFEIVHIGGTTLGRAIYEPGWKWSEHVGHALGQTRCDIEHIGLVIQGRATAAMNDGRVVELRA